jgi:ribonuclease HII
VAGADEAGRGSLAGPLVAAGVLIDHAALGRTERIALGLLNDSKQMAPDEREQLYPAVLRAATRVAVRVCCPNGIDARGLHVSNLAALRDCLERVGADVPGDGGVACLVDGFRLPECGIAHTAVVDGDARSATIAAASVVAKVTRDRYMRRADGAYPGWDFAGNVGYSTPEHRAKIREVGISALHRRSFNSIAYSQLEFAGGVGGVADADLIEAADELADPELAGGSEGIADVLEVDDAPRAVEAHPDHVEPQRADAA